MSALEEAKQYSSDKLVRLRERLVGAVPEGISVVVTGSFARGEASQSSDLDYFLLFKDEPDQSVQDGLHERVTSSATDLGISPASTGGAFDKATEKLDQMLANVGGDQDTNKKLTRRLLTLLEGTSVANEDLFDSCRTQLIAVYVKDHMSDHKLARFLLNDIVRYWRTIGVDFEFKVTEDEKPWGTRYLKLLFSRKLIYFSGLLMVAQTAQRTREEKIEILTNMCSKCAIDRIEDVCGPASERALTLYAEFMERLADKDFRDMANAVKMEDREPPAAFRKVRNAGQYFSWELERLLLATYGLRHPIHHALIF